MNAIHKPHRFFEREADFTLRLNEGEVKEGQLKYWMQGPIWVTQVKGWGLPELAREVARGSNEVIARHGKIIAINDWYELTSIDREAREIQQKNAHERKERGVQREGLICVSSVVTKMSIMAASVLLGGWFETFLDYKAFIARFEELRRKYGQ